METSAGPFAGRLQWLRSPRLDWLQSCLVLPTARTLYLVGSLLCAIAIVLALAVALVFQVGAWQPAAQQTVPDAVTVAPAPASFDRIENRLKGPSGIRFVLRAPFGDELAEGQLVGHFEADAANGLAAYPDDFQIIGGRDAELFEAAYDGASSQTGLRVKPALAGAMKVVSASGGTRRDFVVRVLARDAMGNRSPPADVRFTIDLSQRVAPPPAEAPVTDIGGTGALRTVATTLARIVDSSRATPEYFDAYKYALAEPERCGAGSDNNFVTLYQRALAHVRPRLTKANLGAFYVGLCEVWDDAVARSNAAVQEAAAERQRVMAANAESLMAAEMRRASSLAVRNAALAFAASALVAFMTVALFLAFLAIEGHSNAVRQAIEALARREAADAPPHG